MSSFTNALVLRIEDGPFVKAFRLIVAGTFTWFIGEVGSSVRAIVTEGETTDGYSIPFFVRWLLERISGGLQGAVLHDHGYKYNTVFVIDPEHPGKFRVEHRDRKFWDAQLYDAMVALDVSRPKRRTVNRGVRIGGWYAWRKHRRANLVHPYVENPPHDQEEFRSVD